MAVAIAIGGGIAEGRDEELGERGLVAFAAGLGGGDHDAAGRGDRGQEGAARAAGVDEGDALGRQLAQQLRPLVGREVRPRQVERRLRAVEAAVADAAAMSTSSLGLTRAFEIRERLLDSPPWSTRRSVGERDVGVRHRIFRLGRVDERGRPLLEPRGVLLVAGDAGDDEQVRSAGRAPAQPTTRWPRT